MKFRFRHIKKGFALTEVLLAVAVIIIIGISGYKMYDSSRKQAEALRVENAVVSLIKLTGVNKRMIAPAIPVNSSSDSEDPSSTKFMDVMGVFSQLGLLDTSIFNDRSIGQDNTAGMTGDYSQMSHVVDVLGTKFQIGDQITSYGGNSVNNHFIFQGNTDKQGCIYVVKGILPLFDTVSVNYIQVKSNGFSNGNPGVTGTSIADLATACGTAATVDIGGTTYDTHNTIILGDKNGW